MFQMIRSVGLLVPPSTPVSIDMQVYLPCSFCLRNMGIIVKNEERTVKRLLQALWPVGNGAELVLWSGFDLNLSIYGASLCTGTGFIAR